MSEKTGEKQKAQAESRNRSCGGTTFVAGRKSESGHVDERPKAHKNNDRQRIKGLSSQPGRPARGAEKTKGIEESPAQSHRDDRCGGFFMENGVADDAGEKCGSKERDDGRG